jgi:drug/metabolite transporter (DMT)-like permease
VSKVVLEVIPPLTLVWLRYLVALAALGGFGLMSRISWRIAKRDIPLVAAIGLIGYLISICAQFIGTKLSTAQLGSVVTSSTPAFMVVFAYPLLKERVTWRKGLSLVLATLGVVMVVGIGFSKVPASSEASPCCWPP